MSDVVSFRPTPEGKRIIERVRHQHHLKTTAEAIRHLIRAAQADPAEREDPDERLFALRAPVAFRLGDRTLTREEIDAEVYDESDKRDSDS